MMREELGLEEPDPKRAPRRAGTIGLSYIAGGLLPLAPYALGLSLTTAFTWSIGVTLVALAAFGAVKARFTGVPILRGAVQTVVVGGAAGVAYGLAAWSASSARSPVAPSSTISGARITSPQVQLVGLAG
jgi:VIT1/CCC1 family predicted Fe2+/Mn2+ transporter